MIANHERTDKLRSMHAAGRKAVCVRMSIDDRRTIGAAAQDHRMSMNSFILGAALDRVRRETASVDRAEPDLDAEAETAVAALESAGLTPGESRRRVERAVAESPGADADQIVAAAFAGGVRP